MIDRRVGGDTAMATESPRVDALIEAAMARYKGHGTLAQARYYEAVHQELAPLARELEAENAEYRTLLRELLVQLCENPGLREDGNAPGHAGRGKDEDEQRRKMQS